MPHIRKLFPFIKPYWKLVLISLVLLVSLAAMDLAIPRLVQQIIDQGIAKNDTDLVVQTSLLMLGISFLSALVAIGNNIYSIRAGEGVARDLREALFVKMQSFSYGNLDTFTTGELMVRLTSDTSAFQRLVQVSLRIGTRGPLMMIGSLVLMFVTAPSLALTILPLLVVTTVLIILFSSRLEPLFRATQQKLDRLNTVLQENIAGVRLVKAFVRAGHEAERFEDANEAFTERTVRVMKFMAVMGPALTILVNAGMVIVVWAGGLRAINNELTIGQIIAFTNYLLSTMGPLIMMTQLSNTWANGFASAQRINKVLDTIPEVQEQPQAAPFSGEVLGRVTFENVSFHYNGSESGLVLDGINLEAAPGKTVAILGATGSGKTSLVNLVPRFYDPSAGRVLIDGQDIRTLRLDSLLQHIAIVPQETVLFSGSVADNIRYGRHEAADEEVITAAQAAQAHEFILALPYGYDTHVEERGVNLSGGQKQRIAIARALVARPRILILDDSTSSVDIETETRIQDALARQLPGCTRFVVAQRISTVLNADKIAVLERGRLAALGTHSELMQSSPIYREIYDSQLGSGFQQAPAAALLPEAARAQ